MATRTHCLGEAIEDASEEGVNFIDWPGSASERELRQLRSEGYRVFVDGAGVHVGWSGTWWGGVADRSHSSQPRRDTSLR